MHACVCACVHVCMCADLALSRRFPPTADLQAREVRCGPDGELIDATMSDNGYVIISVFFNATGSPLKYATFWPRFRRFTCRALAERAHV